MRIGDESHVKNSLFSVLETNENKTIREWNLGNRSNFAAVIKETTVDSAKFYTAVYHSTFQIFIYLFFILLLLLFLCQCVSTTLEKKFTSKLGNEFCLLKS